MAKGAHGFNHVNAKMVLVKIPHTVREFGLTVCPFFGFLPLMVEGHVPQGVEVQVLSSAQKEHPRTGMFFLLWGLYLISKPSKKWDKKFLHKSIDFSYLISTI
jgi:hypothetical protein